MLSVRQKNEMKERGGGSVGAKGNEVTALEKFVRSWLLDKFLGKYPFVSHPMQHVCAAYSLSFPPPYPYYSLRPLAMHCKLI